MKEPGRPVKLRFFDEKMTRKFTDLCTSLEISVAVGRDDSADTVATQQLTATERRNLINKWADVSMERIS